MEKENTKNLIYLPTVGYTASKWCKPGFKSNNHIPLEMSTTMLRCIPKASVKEQGQSDIPGVLTTEDKDKQSDQNWK